jgi:hypothetical protein
MSLIYKIQKKVKEMRDNGFVSSPAFFEGDTYLEMFGRTYNKDSLSEEKISKMPRPSYYARENFDNINTETRKYSVSHESRVVGGRIPFKPKDTILEGSIMFSDGTEIVPADHHGGSYTALYQYRYGEILNVKTFTNSLGNTPLVKIDDGTFILIRNSSNYINGGAIQQAPSEFTTIHNTIGWSRKNQPNVSHVPVGYYPYFYTKNDATSLSVPSNGTAYNSCIAKSDTISLLDKNLNVIKEVHLEGEVINVIGRTPDGSLIAVTQSYIIDAVEGFKSKINLVSISPTLIITNIFSEVILAPLTDLESQSSYSGYQIPSFDSDTDTLYFLSFINGISIRSITLDFNSSTIIAQSTFPIQDLVGKQHAKDDFFTNQFRLQLGVLKQSGRTYVYLTHTFSNMMPSYEEDRVVISGSSSYSSHRAGALNITHFFRNYGTVEAPLFLMEIGTTDGSVSLRDTLPLKDITTDGLRAIFPLGDSFVLLVKDNGLWLYGIDSVTQRFTLLQNVNAEIRSVGIDNHDRIWFIKDTDEYHIEMISPFLSTDVLISFEDTDITFTSSNIDTNIVVEAMDLSGQRQEIEIKLILEGNAIFRETQAKSITILTSSIQALRIPIVITGSGSINVYTAFNE